MPHLLQRPRFVPNISGVQAAPDSAPCITMDLAFSLTRTQHFGCNLSTLSSDILTFHRPFAVSKSLSIPTRPLSSGLLLSATIRTGVPWYKSIFERFSGLTLMFSPFGDTERGA
eukprot:gnl/MRDRNA2_/MRDRNA2_71550_c0_seq1.p2 gnl/MRDRNA2_/MRDRNA2_71550_c0~~gnl/MRDRNA2_/MRDRNA2_71550_c0_seq1.p2  ORF type:complete len:114 (+),score=7.23 gnl/MRDRNA2_/MRDRNA2_71550_c0_seq1:85-426(+)